MEAYIDGNVSSESARRYITDLLAATAVRALQEQEGAPGESDADAWDH